MPDNQNNPEAFGESISAPAAEVVAEVSPQYEAQILLAVEESNKSIMNTPEERAEIVGLEDDIQSELGGVATERTTVAAESLEGRKFTFPGISERYNATLSAERAECQDFFIGTWDELTEKFKAQGIKVHTGKNGEIYILPAESTDVENDGIMPRHLEITEDMDENLKKLILANTK